MKKIEVREYKRPRYLCEFCSQYIDAKYKLIIQTETDRKFDFDFCEKHFQKFREKINEKD